jgi:acid stress-induced BolA-like protein IbaG/YrbA
MIIQGVEGKALRVVVDSNGYDFLVASPEIQELAIQAREQGIVKFLMTHVQVDELSAMFDTPNEWKVRAALAIPYELAATHGIVLGVSRMGLARIPEEGALESIIGSSNQVHRDALIAETARCEEAVLVTGDKVLMKKARRVGVEVWSPQDFLEFIRDRISSR